MPIHNTGPTGLSEAARQTLDELSSQRQQQVIRKAMSAARGHEITAADIVRAYYSVDESGPPYEATESLRPSQVRPTLVVIAALFAFITIGAIFVSQLVVTGGERLFNAPGIIAIIGLVTSFAAAASVLMLQYSSARHLREERRILSALDDDDPRNQDHSRKMPSDGTEIQQRGLFLVKWVAVEEKLRELAIMHQPKNESESLRFQPVGSLMANLTGAGVIDRELASDIRKVVTVRNKVAHQEPVPHSQMLNGMEIIGEVEQRLSRLLK